MSVEVREMVATGVKGMVANRQKYDRTDVDGWVSLSVTASCPDGNYALDLVPLINGQPSPPRRIRTESDTGVSYDRRRK
jgi:hypothetical protein